MDDPSTSQPSPEPPKAGDNVKKSTVTWKVAGLFILFAALAVIVRWTMIFIVSSREPHDTGKWAYVRSSNKKENGKVFIDCTHTDIKGSVWTSY